MKKHTKKDDWLELKKRQMRWQLLDSNSPRLAPFSAPSRGGVRPGAWILVMDIGNGKCNLANREPLSKRVRFEVFKRDNFTCQYCGRKPPQVILHADHVIPVADGGPNDMANLVTSCEPCNNGKGAVPLSRVPEHQRESVARQRESIEQMAALNQFLIEKREAEAAAIERLGLYWFSKGSEDTDELYVFNDHYAGTIRTFLREMPEADILDAIDITASRKSWYSRSNVEESPWRYFCGVCWRKIKRARGEEN